MRSFNPKTSNSHRLALLLLPAVLATCPLAWAEEDAKATPDLFEPAPAPPQGFEDRPYVVQSRAVLVHVPALFALAPQDEINLNLFPESTFTGVVERVDRRSPTRYTVAGRLAGVPHSSFIIVVEEDVAVALVEAPTLYLMFRLGYVGDGVHEIAQINNARFPKCGNEGKPNRAGPQPKPERERAETQPRPPSTAHG